MVEVVLSLKFGLNIPGVGSFRSVSGKTLESVRGKTKILVLATFRRGKRSNLKRPIEVWISENSIMARQFDSPTPEQGRLAL